MIRPSRLYLFALILLSAALSLAQSGYQAIAVNGGGTITGSVKWTGPVPKLPTIAINKDPEVCDPKAEKKRDLERLVIGSNGGVANTVVFLKTLAKARPWTCRKAVNFSIRRPAVTNRTSCWFPITELCN